MMFGGRYEATELLSESGTTALHAGRDTVLDRPVAIKTLSSGAAPADRARFLDQAKLLGSLQHPHLLPIHGFGVDGEQAWLVMPHLRGEPLSYEDHCQSLSPVDVAHLLLPLAEALDYCHSRGLVHGAVCPESIHVAPVMRPILMDLGVARRGDDAELQERAASYAAPEWGADWSPDPAADQYSLAVVLFEMVAGRGPFSATDPLALRFQHTNATPARVSTFRAGVPPSFDEAMNRALSKDPGARFPRCAELLAALGVDPSSHSLSAISSVAAPADEPEPADGLDRLRVLVVEDEATDYMIVERQLSRSDLANIECMQARRLSEIPEALARFAPDVILLDLGLPDSMGLDTLRHLRAITQDVPIVLQTGADEPHLATDALGLGAQDFVLKGDADGRALTYALLYAVDRHSLLRGEHPDALRVRATGLLTRSALLDRLAMSIAHAERRGTTAVLGLLESADGSGPESLRAKLAPWEGLGRVGDRAFGFVTDARDGDAARARVKELIAGPSRWRVRMSLSPDQGTTAGELFKAVGL